MNIDISNYGDALTSLDMTPQESFLYQMHLNNLHGPGGVDNPNGSRSSLYQSVQEHNGAYYNIPTVWDGNIETEKWTHPSGKEYDIPNATALSNVEKIGWDKFPSYPSPDEADERYSQMHDYMEKDTAAFLQSR